MNALRLIGRITLSAIGMLGLAAVGIAEEIEARRAPHPHKETP